MSVPPPAPGALPRVSVVIPVRDDAAALDACLAHLARQRHRPHEVLVVDNGSQDGSADVARSHGARVVTEPLVGIAPAVWTGYSAATGEVIARCDADTRPGPDWVARIAAVMALRPELDGLTGPGSFHDIPGLRGGLAAAVYHLGYFVGAGAAAATVPLWGSNMALRRSAWCRVRDLVHRTDAAVHDDLDLTLCLGPTARTRFDPLLRVTVAGRMFASPAAVRRRFAWAFHTLALHRAELSPGRRWVARVGSWRGRRGLSRAAPSR